MVGIVSEGRSDQGIIINILKGICGIDESEILPIRPREMYDETDLSSKGDLTLGGWSRVKMECESKEQINAFLALDGNDYVVIQIDTAECDQYGVERPKKDEKYCPELRSRVKSKIQEWLATDDQFAIYAISIEEIEAWLLTTLEKKDSAKSADPKSKYEKASRQKAPVSIEDGKSYSKSFRKMKNFSQYNYGEYNCSLKLFCQELKGKICG